jgi:probable rRNA maturation factor
VPTLLGDVLVCPLVAEQQYATHAGTFEDEIALLVVHGTLHVLGFDHDIAEAAATMREHEMTILKEHHWRGSAPVGFRQDHDE